MGGGAAKAAPDPGFPSFVGGDPSAVPLQIPCYDLTLLVEGRLEYPMVKAASPTPN